MADATPRYVLEQRSRHHECTCFFDNDIAKYTGVDPLPPEEQHSALNDAVWQAELFRRLIHLSTL